MAKRSGRDVSLSPLEPAITATSRRPLLECLPTLLSHSSQVSDENYIAGGAAGKEILIIGAGASAIDLAAMLGQAGASVTIIARRSSIAYCDAPAPRTWLDDVRAPVSGLGTGWRLLMSVKAPLLFHHMPEPFKLLVFRKHLGPAPGWVPREYVEKHVAMKLGATIAGVREVGGRAELSLRSADGARTVVAGDFVIAATGYRPDLRRLTFIGRSVRGGLRCVDHTPILDRQFQSSVPWALLHWPGRGEQFRSNAALHLRCRVCCPTPHRSSSSHNQEEPVCCWGSVRRCGCGWVRSRPHQPRSASAR